MVFPVPYLPPVDFLLDRDTTPQPPMVFPDSYIPFKQLLLIGGIFSIQKPFFAGRKDIFFPR